MKSITKLVLAIAVLALATIACGSDLAPVVEVQERVVVVTATPESEPTAKPTARPTARPTAIPSCFTKSDLVSTIREYYGVSASFAYDPDVSNWDQTSIIYDGELIINVSYDISDGCITGLGTSVSVKNDFYRAGEWLALSAMPLIGDNSFFNAYESFVSSGLEACV